MKEGERERENEAAKEGEGLCVCIWHLFPITFIASLTPHLIFQSTILHMAHKSRSRLYVFNGYLCIN